MNNLQRTALICAPLLLLLISSCNDNAGSGGNPITNIFSKDVFNAEEVSKIIGTTIKNPAAIWPYADSTLHTNLSKLYAANNNTPIWLNDKGVIKCADSLLLALSTLPQHGIDAGPFKMDVLTAILKDAKAGKLSTDSAATRFEMGLSAACLKLCNAVTNGALSKEGLTEEWYNEADTNINFASTILNLVKKDSVQGLANILAPQIDDYKALQRALEKLQKIDNAGGWQKMSAIKDSITLGSSSPAVVALRKRLNLEMSMPADTTSTSVSADLIAAIQRFQYMHDIMCLAWNCYM
jgi:murein L,D-transpeptidase YcbB/YkuD